MISRGGYSSRANWTMTSRPCRAKRYSRPYERNGAIAGQPEIAIEQIRAYEQAGVEELMLEWFPADDVEGAEAFATNVLSRLSR